jgi:formylglycine-generating enzyme required for sulfatase activity
VYQTQLELKTSVEACVPTTWTDDPGPNEALPMTCLNWYTALAFCVWDGGRLPTEAEWFYAAAGGDEQLDYPWSTPGVPSIPSPDDAVYECDTTPCCISPQGCFLPPVGSKSPIGDGRWKQADLAGSVWEWTFDWFAIGGAYPDLSSCHGCANTDPATSTSPPSRVLRGGFWDSGPQDLNNAARISSDPRFDYQRSGARCARNL